jgi:ABC-type branched-subunit amino acid transport system ATPase component
VVLDLRLADSVVCLDGGKIIMSGDPETVARHPAVLEAYLGPAWATPATEVTP